MGVSLQATASTGRDGPRRHIYWCALRYAHARRTGRMHILNIGPCECTNSSTIEAYSKNSVHGVRGVTL